MRVSLPPVPSSNRPIRRGRVTRLVLVGWDVELGSEEQVIGPRAPRAPLRRKRLPIYVFQRRSFLPRAIPVKPLLAAAIRKAPVTTGRNRRCKIWSLSRLRTRSPPNYDTRYYLMHVVA